MWDLSVVQRTVLHQVVVLISTRTSAPNAMAAGTKYRTSARSREGADSARAAAELTLSTDNSRASAFSGLIWSACLAKSAAAGFSVLRAQPTQPESFCGSRLMACR